MKRIIILIASVLAASASYAQHSACINDTVHLVQSSYRGKLTWHSSLNGTDWSLVQGAQGDTLRLTATLTAYYRTEVSEGTCRPYTSEPVYLMVNSLPVVSLTLRDSVCLNETTIQMTGGFPAGGSYSGPGIIDNRLIPGLAGPGSHRVDYRYRDTLTGCTGSASSTFLILPVANRADAGSDQITITSDSVRLTANAAENGTGTWTVAEGTGGRFSDPNRPDAWFIKEPGQLDYKLRWTISGKCGTTADEVLVNFFPLSKHPCPGTPIVRDADGNLYPTVQIGNQCWMAKNLNVGRTVTSTVQLNRHSNVSDNQIIEKYCYENKPENCATYGGLYEWDEAMGYVDAENNRGICPEGWHIPGNNDWIELNQFFPTFQAGEYLKIGGDSGFLGDFTGVRHETGEFYSFGSGGFWWQSTSYSEGGLQDAYLRKIEACNGNLSKANFSRKTGLSIRCIKDR